MTNDQAIQQLDQEIANCKPAIAVAEALERLKANKDFQDVILTGYLQEEAVRLVHLKGDPKFAAPEQQAAILADINAIGSLNQYFATKLFIANQARSHVAASEELREQILAGETE